MKRMSCVALVLAVLTAGVADAAETMKNEEGLNREAAVAELTAKTANSNLVAVPIPQLSANPNTGPEVPMAREPNPPATSPATVAAPTSPAAAQTRSPWWMILAVLAVLLGSYFLKRLRSRLAAP
jgi:hypothetical protein